MEISGSPFVWGDPIYKWGNGFTTKVACLANYLDQVTQRVNLILRVTQNYQEVVF